MSGRTFPRPRPVRRSRPLTPLSRCGCPAPNPFGSRPSSRARSSRPCFQERSSRFGRGRLRRHLIVERCGSYVSPVKERRTRRCNADAFFVSISRRARARRRCCRFRDAFSFELSFEIPAHGSGFAPTTSRPFGSRIVPRSFLRLGSGSRSLAILPALSDHDVTRASDPGELGHLSAGCSPEERPARWLGTSGHAWVRPGGDPGPFDRCLLLTDVVFKDDRPTSRHTSHRLFPRDTRACGFTPQGPLRRTVGPRQGVVFPSRRIRRRTSDAPSPAGSPGGAMSTGVGPRSLARSQVVTRKPRPTPPSRVNGFLGLALARSTFSLRSLSDRIGDPIRSLPRPRPFQDAISRESNESFCRVTDPRGTTRAPNPRRCRSALLSKRGIPSGVNGSVPGTAPPPVAPPRQGDRIVHAPSDPCGPALARTSRSPPTSSVPTSFVIVG